MSQEIDALLRIATELAKLNVAMLTLVPDSEQARVFKAWDLIEQGRKL